jgi:hypothetical protein
MQRPPLVLTILLVTGLPSMRRAALLTPEPWSAAVKMMVCWPERVPPWVKLPERPLTVGATASLSSMSPP